MRVYITYDLSNSDNEVKEKMIELGYSDSWKFGEVNFNLPNTCLWIRDMDNTDSAVTDLNNVVNELNRDRLPDDQISIKRCIALEFMSGKWSGIRGSTERP